MKTYFLPILTTFIICFLWGTGYTQDTHSHPVISNPPHEIVAPHLQTPKNYFDIRVDEKEGDRFFSEFMSMLTTLGLIVVVVLLATWFLKRMLNTRIQQMNTSSMIKIIEHRTLSTKSSLFLLDINGEGVILAESLNGVTRLGSFNLDGENKKNTEDKIQKTE